jgi:hypothetical protein
MGKTSNRNHPFFNESKFVTYLGISIIENCNFLQKFITRTTLYNLHQNRGMGSFGKIIRRF